ncbi:DUF937 domain-containing protein [Sandaracinobacteroides sp. A072]|uniref:DUF937 domain-containing protein n=1 Tax=Sandaracinobacteroides sp. A072 TaxID=3461146 RepID=UPI00404203E1
MNIADILKQAGALDSMARELGVDGATAQAGAAALLPAILGGFRKQAQPAPGGLEGLIGQLAGQGGGSLLDAVTGASPTPVQPGNDILGQIFGSKDVSRAVAGQASQTSGIDSNLLKKMLPMLAMAVTGYLASQKAGAAQAAPQSGGLGGMVGQVLGGIMGGGKTAPSQAGPAGGLASLLDFDGDGNPLDDILGMASRLGR